MGDLAGPVYGAARFSQILADDGFPIAGQAPFGSLFNPNRIDKIWRLSLGLGYRWSEQMVVKSEYSFERGDRIDGASLSDRDVFCSIHKTMNCIILVLENPYFDKTDEKGRYLIPNVPAGTYTLRAWHERMPAQTRNRSRSYRRDRRSRFPDGHQGTSRFLISP